MLVIIDQVQNRPSPIMLCNNFCFPKLGKITQQYEPTNSMEYTELKYCICQ